MVFDMCIANVCVWRQPLFLAIVIKILLCCYCCSPLPLLFFVFCLLRIIERSVMMRWVVGSILHGVDPLRYFSFQPVLHNWCNKGRGMCYPVCGMVHIKEPLLLIDKSRLWRQRVSFLTIRIVLNHMSDPI